MLDHVSFSTYLNELVNKVRPDPATFLSFQHGASTGKMQSIGPDCYNFLLMNAWLWFGMIAINNNDSNAGKYFYWAQRAHGILLNVINNIDPIRQTIDWAHLSFD